MKFTKLITAILPLAVFACTSAPSEKMPPKVDQIKIVQLQKEWKLIEVDGNNLSIDIKSTLHIDSRLKATGSLGCNRFFGNAELNEHTFIINKMSTTRRMCNREINKIEKMVSATLENWSQVQVSETQLILKSKSHTLKYKFEL